MRASSMEAAAANAFAEGDRPAVDAALARAVLAMRQRSLVRFDLLRAATIERISAWCGAWLTSRSS